MICLCYIRPPYRLENYTSYDIRFKQSVEQTGLFKQNLRVFHDSLNFDILASNFNDKIDKSLRRDSKDSIKSNVGDDNVEATSTKPLIESLVEWDSLAANTTKPYTYDHPFSCLKNIQIEFNQGSYWKTIDVCLDEVNHVNSKYLFYDYTLQSNIKIFY